MARRTGSLAPGLLLTLIAAGASTGCGGGCGGGSLSGSGGFPGLGRDGGGQAGATGAGQAGASGGLAGFGTGNVGGLVGTGAAGGSASTGGNANGGAGSPNDPCGPVLPGCPTALCGNGVRDTCVARPARESCPQALATEMCDGADVGGQSCRGLGYGSGTLACQPSCLSLDLNRCSECEPLAGPLIACQDAPVGANAVTAAIAATDDVVGIAWTTVDLPNMSSFRFARLAPDLSVLSSGTVGNAAIRGVSRLELATLPSGWLIAGYADPAVFVISLDADGNEIANTVVETVGGDRLLAGPVLAQRPDGGPLLVWITGQAVRSAVIAADGRSATVPIALAPSPGSGTPLDAAWIGDSFYVSITLETADNPTQLRLFRVGPGGALASTIDALPRTEVWNATFVRGASDLRVVYEGPATLEDETVWSLMWRRVSTGGAALAAPVVLAIPPDPATWARGLAFGDDTALIYTTFSSQVTAHVTRFGPGGDAAAPPFQIARRDITRYAGTTIVRRGPEAVVMWRVPGRIGLRLARVSP